MSPRILIVEDEEPLLELLRYNFEKAGYAVEAIANGDQAAARLKETVPDLLVLDWMLPGLSGIELCRRLRQANSTRSLPIIILTARGEESDRVRGLDTGADDYVVKPFSVNELLAASPRCCAATSRCWWPMCSRSATSSSTAWPCRSCAAAALSIWVPRTIVCSSS